MAHSGLFSFFLFFFPFLLSSYPHLSSSFVTIIIPRPFSCPFACSCLSFLIFISLSSSPTPPSSRPSSTSLAASCPLLSSLAFPLWVHVFLFSYSSWYPWHPAQKLAFIKHARNLWEAKKKRETQQEITELWIWSPKFLPKLVVWIWMLSWWDAT